MHRFYWFGKNGIEGARILVRVYLRVQQLGKDLERKRHCGCVCKVAGGRQE
jgi:hypothetical protein